LKAWRVLAACRKDRRTRCRTARYEYDAVLKRTVEITPSGERFPLALVDGKLKRDLEKIARRKGGLPRVRYEYKEFWGYSQVETS
jgi:hypothetical protein